MEKLYVLHWLLIRKLTHGKNYFGSEINISIDIDTKYEVIDDKSLITQLLAISSVEYE